MAVVMFMVSLLSIVSVAYAQEITGANTVSPTSSNLNSVAVVGNTTTTPTLLNSDAWAVGNGGVIIQWNGTNWSTFYSPTSTNLYDIIMVNSNLGFAVGGNSNSGIILQYSNGNWSIMSTGFSINAALYGVTADSSGSPAWAVGADGTILKWDGNQWSQSSSPTNNTLRSVAMVHGSNNAWAVGDGGAIIQYDGSNWSNIASPTTGQLNAIVMVTTTSGWAVGGSSNTGIILNLNANAWINWSRIDFGGAVNSTTGYVTDTINATLYSLSIDTADSAWAVGAGGTTLYWTGTEWAGQTNVLNIGNINSIAMTHGTPSGTSYAWAVGDGGSKLAWTGTSWIPEFSIIALPVILSAIALVAFIGKTKLGKKPQI